MDKDIIYRADAIDAIHGYWKGELSKMPTTDSEYGEVIDGDCATLLKHNKELSTRIKDIPSADRPQGDSVSRRYLLAEIDDLADEFSEVDEKGLHSDRWCGIMDSKGIIVNAPSVSSRPQGEWKHLKGDEWLCSNCGYVVRTEGSWEHPLERGKDYCEHCGAHMKGADDE